MMETLCLSSSLFQNYSPSPSPSPLQSLSLLQFKTFSIVSCHKPQTIFTSLDDAVCTFLDPPLRPSIDPKHVLSGNFAPVRELPPTACQVQGTLPPCLNGAYIRNGPNPQFLPRGPHHAFDGDGMLHSLKISNGKAVFCSRFVKTYKYQLERSIGAPVILNSFSSFTGLPASLARAAIAIARLLSGQYDLRRGTGTANTSLAHFGGKLFATCESDLPYSVKISPDGDIITLGRDEAFGEGMMTMTAHPKVDGETGEAFAYRHGVFPPFLTYFRINSEGIKQREVPIFSKPQASMVHDLAVTQNYVVFPDTQIVINPGEILKGNPMVRVDGAKVPRLGIMPRNAEDEKDLWWVELPGFNMMHAFNAWEEDDGDTIVMVASNMLPVEHALENVELLHASMERVEINVRTRTAKRQLLSDRSLELASINQSYVGKQNRYVYAALESPMPKVGGVVKLDVSGSGSGSGDFIVASRLFGPGCFGGEPYFVARQPGNGEEDDGYLVSYVHNESSDESEFVVMDAKSAGLDIVASVKLPQRVPYGYHGIFVAEHDLAKIGSA